MKITFVCLMILVCARTSGAFTLLGNSSNALGWSDANLGIMINTSNCPASVDVVAVSIAAMNVWNYSPTSSLKLYYAGSTTSTSSGFPPVIYCETNFQASTGGLDQNQVLGAASPSYSGDSISSGVIRLNVSVGNANISNYSTDVQKLILAHEIGHLIGLGHSQKASALMYYSTGTKTTPVLSQDDIDGISYLYPANELNGKNMAGCGLVGSSQPPSSGKVLLSLLFLFVPLLIYGKLRWPHRFA